MTFETMKQEEMDTCAVLAAKAFAGYDFFSVYVPGSKRRSLFLRNMLKVEYRINQGLAHCLVGKQNGRIVAIAIVRDPGYRMPTVREYLRAGFWKNLVIGGYRNVAAWFEMDQKAGIPCQEQCPDAWFVHLLAVETDFEGRGIGSRMMQEGIIPYVKKHGGKSLCLYTNSEINCQFYKKNGFEEFDSQMFGYKGKSFGSWSFRKVLS